MAQHDSRRGEPGHSAVIPAVATCHWYAARTRSRAEKAAQRVLSANGVECYLPLIERKRHWADRTKLVEFPLFPGYLFVFCARDGIGSVLAKVPGLVGVVRQSGVPCVVRADELDAVRILVEGVRATGKPPVVSQELAAGDPIRVIAGPFEGLAGTLLEDRNGVRVVVRISAVRQAASIELDRACVRPRRWNDGRAIRGRTFRRPN